MCPNISNRRLANKVRLWAVLRPCVAGVCLALVGGCASVVVSPTLSGPSSGSEASGDRDDIWPAITAAMTQNEMAVMDVYYEPPDRRIYLIKCVRDEPVRLTLDGPGFGEGVSIVGPFLDGRDGPSGGITMTCRVGRFGDAKREQKLMRDVATRLRQLEGVDVSRIRY